MKIKHIFSLAVLAVMTVACSSEDLTQQPASQSGQTLPFRATISNYAGTRGLTEATDGKSITAAWEKEEKIALVHGTTVNVMEVESVDATTKAAIISGNITEFDEGETVYLVYTGHNKMSMDDYPEMLLNIFNGAKTEAQNNSLPEPTAITQEMIIGTFSIPQEGTLADINDCSDYRLGTSTLKQTNGWVTLNGTPTLASQFAMWKLTLTTDGTTPLEASQLYITCGGKTYTIDPTGDSSLSTFYVLLPASTNATYDFKATTSAGVNYYCTHSGITLEAGMFYRSTLTVSKLAGSISYAETNVQKNYGDGAFTHPLTNTGDGVVTYESTNTAVAEVDENGSVTIKGIGSTTIKATVADSNDYTYATNTAEYTLTVTGLSDPDDYSNGSDPFSF